MASSDPAQRGSPSGTAGTERSAPRRPGELAFTILALLASLGLLWHAFGIENPFGPNGLSAPRAIPVAATLAMAVSAAVVLIATARRPLDRSQRLSRDVLPPVVLVIAGLLAAYGLLLRPLGFLPVSALFLVISIRLLGKRGWLWTFAVSLGSLLAIWLVFRIVFSVLMPAGIVPEAALVTALRKLLGGGFAP